MERSWIQDQYCPCYPRRKFLNYALHALINLSYKGELLFNVHIYQPQVLMCGPRSTCTIYFLRSTYSTAINNISKPMPRALINSLCTLIYVMFSLQVAQYTGTLLNMLQRLVHGQTADHLVHYIIRESWYTGAELHGHDQWNAFSG